MNLTLQQTGLFVARALHFWALATLLGGGGFLLLLGRPTRAACMTVLIAASWVAAFSGLAWFGFVLSDVTGDADAWRIWDDWAAFFTSPFAAPWAIRLALLIAALGAASVARRASVFVVIGTLLVLDQAWLGHAATGTGWDGLVQIAFYWIHVLAGLAWTGALVMLVVEGLAGRKLPLDALQLFSDYGIAVVIAVLASGTVNACLRMQTPAALITTTYGVLVLAKLCCLAGMIALAAFNRRASRLRDSSTQRLGLAVGIETSLGLAVLALAAGLGMSPPPAM